MSLRLCTVLAAHRPVYIASRLLSKDGAKGRYKGFAKNLVNEGIGLLAGYWNWQLADGQMAAGFGRSGSSN